MDGIHDSEATGDITEMTERRREWAEPVADAGRRPTARNAMLVGGLSLLVCIFSFVGQTTATRRVQESYQQPYLILWISHSFWIIMLPLHTLYEKLKRRPRSLGALRAETLVASAKLIVHRKRQSAETATSEYRPIQTVDPDASMQMQASGTALGSDGTRVRTAFKDDDEEGGADTPDADAYAEADVNDASDADGARALARRRPWWIMGRMTLLAALLVGLLNASAYLWYVAVALTSMSKVTAIYNMSCFFAYLFSILLLGERVQIAKCAAVAVSIVGVVLMALVGSGSGADAAVTPAARNAELMGDALALTCACGIGLYQVLYKKYAVPRDFHSLFAVNFMTSMLGLCTLMLFWIPVPIFHITGIERFHWPTRAQMLLILANALAGVAYNGCFMIALALTSPLFAAVGVMLTIPAMAVVDMTMQGHVLDWNVFAGGAAILTGFCILTLAEYRDTVHKAERADSASEADIPAIDAA
ncbi:hypothetical protein GGH19_003671 [Coemansia sp. RSA 1807]|nr:hypothetical protein LPJ67_000259 [Coemansia sp. RSA 1938]KAJ2249583.1 hypothetical protein GGH97_001242 [Coemansia sp. RSA 475]KAJ2256454.1 hypothetical protein GGH98_001507 [Coemansia sp. RSA 454]KAJ2446971.1 hypothetical protein IWW46_000584 [Coemansia sp. RSA 2440]KAJ2574595.1 hypothetical protein GGH19_003671 [Coemansia sp. RSA 1807]KAJ2593634.1 hypothetical protein IWW49_000390 [Coemansia sp. RSA 1797]